MWFRRAVMLNSGSYKSNKWHRTDKHPKDGVFVARCGYTAWGEILSRVSKPLNREICQTCMKPLPLVRDK